LGLRDFIRGLKTGKPDPLRYPKKSYEKSNCTVCGRVCYNKEDLQLHLKYNHPDVASTTKPTWSYFKWKIDRYRSAADNRTDRYEFFDSW